MPTGFIDNPTEATQAMSDVTCVGIRIDHLDQALKRIYGTESASSCFQKVAVTS